MSRKLLTAIIAIACAHLFVSLDEVNGQLLVRPQTKIDAATSGPIRDLLVKDWEKSPTNAAASKTTFAKAGNYNADLLLAYTVNRIQHNKITEARTYAEELTSRFSSNLDGWMLKIWMNTLVNKYDLALINMRSFKQELNQKKDLPIATQNEIYKRLGRLIGYLQGPVVEKVNADILDETVLRLANGIPPEVLKTFNENRDKILKAHDELLNEQGKKTQVELVKVKAENDQAVISLTRENQLLEKKEADLRPEKERLRGDAARAIAALEQQSSSISQQLSSISSDIQSIQFDLQFLYIDLNNILLTPPRYRPSTYFVRNQIRNAELNLVSLRNTGAGLSNQLNGIRNQISQVNYSLNRQIKDIDKQIKKANGSRRRNQAKLGKIARGPELKNEKKGAMRNKQISLTTYDSLQVEVYRQELLDLLSK
ncbi:MAG: hypothetical protein AB8B55_04955 [Mariniblastus sp.]